MTHPQIDAWFWILVGAAGALAAIGLLSLGVFAFANWRRKGAGPTADHRIVVSIKRDAS